MQKADFKKFLFGLAEKFPDNAANMLIDAIADYFYSSLPSPMQKMEVDAKIASLRSQIIELLIDGKKVHAIKLVHDTFKCPLDIARDYVNSVAELDKKELDLNAFLAQIKNDYGYDS